MRRWITGVLATAIVVAGAPLQAQAAPGDPAPAWPLQRSDGAWSVAVAQSGRVFTLAHPAPDVPGSISLNTSYNGTWPTPTQLPEVGGVVRAGFGPYGIVVSWSEWNDGSHLVSREFINGQWTEPERIGEFLNTTSLDTNTDGDAVIVWRSPDGFMAGVHPRGGSWSTLPVTVAPQNAPLSAAINESGKVALVWSEGTNGTSRTVRRSVLRPGATTWTSPQTLGTISSHDGSPRIVTDGHGRETIVAGGKLWRQRTTNSTPAYAFTVGQYAEIAAGTDDTRVIWPYENGRYLSVRTRQFRERDATESWGPTTTAWAKSFPATVPAECRQQVNTGLGITPGGRSYVALGVVADAGSTLCANNKARLVTLDRKSTPLNDVAVGGYFNGSGFGVAVNARGPVAVDYQGDGADNGWGDTNSLKFFTR
ncbi:hypothetical protein ACFS27_17435 [Promicromonospora vindobonensis]|uniref:Uncharacterized protein n=1 Tax=Promicromonospora vindobonensis TaxID=195748 RepID=A0ABW5VVM4_9MICO